MFHSIKAGIFQICATIDAKYRYRITLRYTCQTITVCYLPNTNVSLQKSEIFDERINLAKNSRVVKKQLLRKNLR